MTITEPGIPAPDWIAVDWGTTNLRVWAMAADGSPVASASSAAGMATLARNEFEPALMSIIGNWLPEDVVARIPVLVCGMAGAAEGWREAGYSTVPCAPLDFETMTQVESNDPRLDVLIVPGLCQLQPCDVMRGEETQIAGLVSKLGAIDMTVCLPGTHSKWVKLVRGRVTEFATAMTGELRYLLVSQSILRHSISEAGQDETIFADAVREGLAHPERLLMDIFGIRAAILLDELSRDKADARLSGLLIGAELAGAGGPWQGDEIHLAGAEPVVEIYGKALTQAGASPIRHNGEEATLAGLATAKRNLDREQGK